MIICSFCSSHNREGELFCQECGNPLQGSPSVATRTLVQTGGVSTTPKPFWGTTRFRADATVMLRIATGTSQLILENKERIVIGRLDRQTGVFPDIDLGPFNAVEKGVSRVHACFLRTEDALNLVDMNSVNGTYLNGQRLIPQQPRVVQDGDEIRFGKLVARIYFK